MKLFKPLMLLSMWACTLLGAWNPSKDLKVSDCSYLKEIAYLNLKNRVSVALEDSWCSREKTQLIMDLVALTRPDVAVEIGVFNGSSLLPIATTLKHLGCGRVYAIDAWSNEEAVKHIALDDPNCKWWSEVDMQAAKKRCLAMVSTWKLKPYCTVFHMPSREAASRIGPIDFLHLDGSFSGEETLSDVKLYLPKVKQGGYILVSNALYRVNGAVEKIAALWELIDHCEVVTEIDGSNAVLLRKN